MFGEKGFSHFLGGFFTVFFFGSLNGRPLLPPSLIASKSPSLYIPDTPMYIYGFLPARWSRLFTASVDIPKRWENTKAVKGNLSIPLLYKCLCKNQAVIAKMSGYLDNYLHTCIVKARNFRKFFEKISFRPLTVLLGSPILQLVNCPLIRTININKRCLKRQRRFI